MADETKLFGTKLTVLKEILNILTRHEFAKANLKQLLNLTNRLKLLQKNVETEGTLNAGGKFEWVDSILVKCLQDGCWLLIENVNLCSPAVLDRLNALLEPNGVLTIGERGVDANGEMVNIVPHPNFRLFLTMDPKNGEISRAMRNRGVEIYMLSEIESGNKNITDIKSLIEQNGLYVEEYQNILLELHDYVSEFVLGEKPNISHILQSAFLISQQLLRGINLIQSFKSAIIDVYIKSKSVNDFNTENVIEIIGEHIVTTFKNYFQTESNYSNSNSINNKTLKTMELQSNSNFALVKQQNVLLENTANLQLLINYFLLSYQTTSYNNLKLRHFYLRNIFDKIQDNQLHQLLNQEIGKILEKLFKRKSHDVPNKDMPLDSLWLIDTKEKYVDTNESNQIFVFLQFAINKIIKEFTELEEPVVKKYSKMTVMQYSKAVCQKKLSQFSIEHPLVNKFYNLVTVFDEFLISLLSNESCGFNSENTISAIAVLNWRFVLQDMGDLIVFDKNNKMFNLNETLSQLIVRYKWFIKNTVNYFKKYSTAKTINDLLKVVEFINKSIENNFSNFAKIAKKFVKNTARPLPLTSVEKINILNDLQVTVNQLSVISTPNNLNKYKLISVSQAVGEQLIEIIKELRKIDFDNLSEITEKLNGIKDNFNCVLQKEIQLTEIQLLPIIDLIGVYILSDLKNTCFLERTSLEAQDKCQILRKLSTVPVELKEILETYFATKDERLIHELRLLTSMYFTNAICLSPSYCLNTNTTEEDSKQLSRHVPVLTNVVTSLCVAFDGNRDLVCMANLGKQKDKIKQLRYLNEVMWKTIPGIYSDADSINNSDAKYVTESFNNFIKLLEKSLTENTTTTSSISDSINNCICKITEIYNVNKGSDEMVRNKEKVMLLFMKLCAEVEKLQNATNIQKTIHTATVYCLLNYIKALFNSQLQVIDPLEKNVLKKKYCEEERTICTNLRDAFVSQNDIYSADNKTLHPFVEILSVKINKYLQKETDLEKLVAVRPPDLTYQSLLKDVSHNLHTLLSEDFFMKMYNKLITCVTVLQKCILEKTSFIKIEDFKDALKQSLNWIHSQTNSFKKLNKYRVGYPDIIQDLLSNLTELSYGIQLLSSVLKKLILKYEYIQEDLSIMLKNMVQFPVLNETQKDTFKLIKLCTDYRNVNFISNVIADEKVPNIAKQETLRLLKCSIQELYNLFVSNSSQYLEPNNLMLNYFEKLINLFVSAWFKQESDRQKKLEEEQSIYKTQSKCENLTEDEEDYKNMKLLFPNYHELDFADFQKTPLGDSEVSASNSGTETEFVGVITSDDVKFVADIHSELMRCFTKCEWLNPKNKPLEVNYLTPLLERYKLFALLQNKLIDGLDSEIEPGLVSSLNLLVSYTRSCAEGVDLLGKINASPKKGKEKSYDFYKDSKVDEVKSCLHIIEALKQRSDELLIEWPSHPTLQSINTLIERIYSFPVTSPVSRFLTGLEILMSKCHEWEENAHSGVSLSEYLQTLTLQIISWRKLELTGWKDCLNTAAERIKNSVSKWWFHIYSTIDEFTASNNKIDSESNTIKLIKTFQEFIEKSPLGEYENRVDLLYTFHCHVLNSPKSQNTDVTIAVLWNLYNYYAQFVSNVETKIKNLRSPIEKKLKDFVKIARWNDINYWAVKETVEKTHKILHKYIKEFEVILRQPVTDCLVNSNTSDSNSENVGIWDRPTRSSPSQYHYSLVASNYMASVKFKKLLADTSIIEEEGIETDSLFSKIEKYFNKSRTLCKDAISATTYPNLIQNLDLFVADIIETSTHLRNLEVNKELTKPKQKSQAKSILQQKRMALADLFKTLTKCGLSYRTGIIEAKLREDQYSEFLLKPIDLNASFKHNMNRGACDMQLLNMWDGCETYFLRMIARLAALDAALKQPAQDLGAQNTERCKGFSSHLMVLAQEQKAKLIDTTRYFYYIRCYITQLTDCSEISDVIQTDHLKSINNLLTNTIIVMEQYKIFLISCPDEPAFGSDLLDIPIVNTGNQIIIKYRNDPNWNTAFFEIKNIISMAQKVKKLIEKVENKFPSSEITIDETEYSYIHDKNLIITELENIAMKTKELQILFGNNSVINSMNWLRNETEININLLRHEYCNDKDSETTVDKYKQEVEKLMEHILLIIQNVYKKYPAKKITESQDATEESSEQFEDNHLKVLVVDNLFNDISALEMKSIFKKVKKINEKLYKMNTKDSKICKTLISNCIPLLEQVALMYQFFITQQIAAYRVTCKLSSVLLNIFIELVTKGFCIPQEFSDELESEGQNTQQSSGLGLGEGEGEKDVSDRIETEDQLDDAQPAGQERKDEDKDCKEEEKGIEMSDDFEGKLQDVEKNPDDQSQSDSDSDAEKQMGDTEQDSKKLDQQIWGSEEENDDDDADNEEESGKQDKEEKGDGGELEDQQMAAKEDGSKPENEDENDLQDNQDKRKEQQKDINEMDEPEYSEDQVDPYHGNQEPLPEPEPLDLPDDLKLDDGEEKEETGEENPFDIDAMKDQTPLEEEGADDKEKDDNSAENKDKNNGSDSSDEEEEVPPLQDNAMETDQPDDKTEDQVEKNKDDKDSEGIQQEKDETLEEKTPEEENDDASALDNQQSKEDEIQPMDIENVEAADNVQTNPNKSQAQKSEQIAQEESEDKDGVGQSQKEESESGHRGEVSAAQDSLSAQQEKEAQQEKRQRPGEADSKRSLGETTEPVKKKLKTVNIQDEEAGDDEAEDEGATEGKDADIYQHIKEAKETDTQVMDTATKEQAEMQRLQKEDEEEKSEEPPKDDVVEMDVDEPEPDMVDTPKQNPEKTESKSQKKADGKQQQGDIVEEIKDVEIEGDLVETMNVPRGNESSYHTQYDLLSENQVERLSSLQIQDLRSELETQLGTWNEPPPNMEAEHTWEKFSAITSSLARDLSEQLRLVLEPTQASRLRGDFRTGRRINMRKVIPYIASQFRKDKIWLRRTKPSKREYQIVLAIDDSSSMDDNHSKELAFESVALISKALSLLESGQLSVLSFGETTEILHKLTDTFTEKSGVKLLQKFQFQQKKTCVANLVDFVSTMFSGTHTSAPNAKLLIVVSDGRGIFSEGETFVQQAIRRAKFQDIFMVFVIIDNPENKNSILDIRMPVFKDGKLLGIKSYLDNFPFPFYIILRDINTLPSVLSDALRQWFELVTNVDK